MADSYLDHIPSQEREKIRKRMRSPDAYEKLRERVKGPEDLEREMEQNEKMAELRFSLETEKQAHDTLKAHVEKDIREQGIEQVVDAESMSKEARKAIEQGKFRVTVSSHPTNHSDQLVVVPEGNVTEKLPVKPHLSQQYTSQLRKGV